MAGEAVGPGGAIAPPLSMLKMTWEGIQVSLKNKNKNGSIAKTNKSNTAQRKDGDMLYLLIRNYE